MRTPLVGRHRELQVLVAACKEESGAVFVRGDAGVGKSSLLTAALAEAELLGAHVLHARFNDLDRHVPYAGLRAALLPSLEGERDGELSGEVEAVASALSLPRGDMAEADAQRQLAGAFEAGRRVLAHWAREQMVVLALDDLHAADPDSLRVIGLLVAHLTGSRFTVLGTLRRSGPDVGTEVGALVERLAGEGLAHVVELAELDRSETRALVHGLLGASPSAHVVDVVWEATAGNAFYVTEAIRALDDTGRLIRTQSEVDVVDAGAPITLSARASLLHRVFEMGPEARTVLRLVAAMQRIALDRVDLIAELSELDDAAVDAAFDRLVAEGFLVPTAPGLFEFAHPIVKATLYEDIGPAGRRRIHQRVAARLKQQRAAGGDVPIGELAAHLSEAAEPGDEDAIGLLVQAGREAYTSAPLTAAGWLARAADLLPARSAERGEVLALEGRSLLLAARPRDAARVGLEAIELTPAGPRAARTAAMVVQALASLGRFEEALAVAEAQLENATGPLPRVQAMRATVLTYLDRFAEAEAELDDALGNAVDQQSRAAVLGAAAACSYAQGDLEGCFGYLDEQEALEAQLGPGSRLASAVVRASYLALSGSVSVAAAILDDACAQSDAMGGSAYRAALDTTRGIVDWLTGSWDGVVEASRKIGVDPDRAGVYGVLARIAELIVSVDRGQYARARELSDEVSASRLGSSFAAWAAARLDAALGDYDDARQTFAKTLEADRASGRRSVQALLLASLIDLELTVGDRAAATEWAALLGASDGWSGPWPTLVATRARAQIEGDAELARAAVAIAEENGLVVEAARSQVVVGACVDEPAAPLTAAYEVFRALGAEPEMRAVAAAMRERGVSVPRAERKRSGPLTETEREIARLVHEGLTNRQIARSLFLSPKTVEVYLGRAFAKTGCANRLELALAVGQGRIEELA